MLGRLTPGSRDLCKPIKPHEVNGGYECNPNSKEDAEVSLQSRDVFIEG